MRLAGATERKEKTDPGPECREPDTEETRALTWSTRSLDVEKAQGRAPFGPARGGSVES